LEEFVELLEAGPRIIAVSDLPKDRKFEPFREPLTEVGRALVAEVQRRVEASERRSRRRKEVDQAVFEVALSALVCDLVAGMLVDPERRTRLEMSKRDLAAGKRRAPFMTEQFPALVRLLCSAELGLVDLDAARPGTRGGRQSTICPTGKFVSLIAEYGVSRHDIRKIPNRSDRSAVELRGMKTDQWVQGSLVQKALKLPWPETEEAAEVQAEMCRINAWLASAELDWFSDPVGDHDLSDRMLCRIFNNGSLQQGGRLYGGFWQKMRAEDRLECICLDDEPVASLDFCQSSVRMAYAEVGALPPDGDLYAIPSTSATLWVNHRSEVKGVTNALLCTDHDIDRFPKGTRGSIGKHVKFAKLLGDIARYHSPIVELFGTARGLLIMKKESDVLVGVLAQLQDHGVHALPIHDGILVPESKAELGKRVMADWFYRVTGAEAMIDCERLCPEGGVGSEEGSTVGDAPAVALSLDHEVAPDALHKWGA
jgi:hypothetical protein